MDETCQKTVPEAIIAFLESEDFEDVQYRLVEIRIRLELLQEVLRKHFMECCYLWKSW